MQIISVVRNVSLYNRLVKSNHFNRGAEFCCFDNNQENKGISERYNEFLDNYDYSNKDWLVFCHEDWEIQENWQKKLEKLDKESLYGPIGCKLVDTPNLAKRYILGRIFNSQKDGYSCLSVGENSPTGTTVGTFDCQCLLVHSDLVKKYKLRFDEKLSFDLYTEDFCINAAENFAISSKIFKLKCQHYSYGDVQPRFYEGIKYLQQKYSDAKGVYSCTVDNVLIGNKNYNKEVIAVSSFFQKASRFFFQKKISKSKKLIIKICRLPVWNSHYILKQDFEKPKFKNGNSKVVYTVISGAYDNLIAQDYYNADYDYVCFSNNPEILAQGKVGIWSIKPLAFDKLDDTKNARWHKTHPHILFPNSDVSIWVDANVNIKTNYLFKLVGKTKKNLLIPIHFSRKCIYKECQEVVQCKKDTTQNIEHIKKILLLDKMPKNYGLNETNIIFRRHNDKKIIKLMEDWWSYIENYSKRDQLSFSYVLWKNKIKIKHISIPNARIDTKNFEFFNHIADNAVKTFSFNSYPNCKLYMNDNVRENFEKDWSIDHLQEKISPAQIIDNGIILPVLSAISEWGIIGTQGGVLNASHQYVKGSESRDCNIKSFETPEKIKFIDEKVIYGGLLIPHYGHFLLESTVRLYYFIMNNPDNLKIAFSVDNKDNIPQYMQDFFRLCEIPTEKIIFVDEYTQFRHVIVPAASSVLGKYYTKEFMIPFQKVRENVPAATVKKIYFTRKHWDGLAQCFGEEEIEKAFELNGYEIIFPEKLSLKEQVALIKGAEIIASINGTSFHNALFAYPGLKLFILNRNAEFDSQYIVNEAAQADWFVVQAYQNPLPANHPHGPFMVGMTDYLKVFFRDMGLNDFGIKFDNKKYLSEFIYQYERTYANENYYHQLILKNKNKIDVMDFMDISEILNYSKINLILFRLLSKITYGKLRRYYKSKHKMLKNYSCKNVQWEY